ncbi:MAG: hypothetical protein ACXACX_19550 [Candidatus Hodarchaeales archaeon]|jgi:hypothetical protein
MKSDKKIIKKQFFFLILLLFYLIVNRGNSHIYQDKSEPSWTSFTLISCNFGLLKIFEGEMGIVMIPDNVTVDLNVSSIDNGYLMISSEYIHFGLVDEVVRVDKWGYEINNTGNYSYQFFSHRLFLIHYSFYNYNSSKVLDTVVSTSLSGTYRLRSIESQSEEWIPFSVGNCYPKSVNILNAEEDIYSVTIHFDITEILLGTLNLNYEYQGGLNYNNHTIDIKTTGTDEFNLKGSNIKIFVSGKNGSYVKGAYYIENFGLINKYTSGFETLISLSAFLALSLALKRRKKHKAR